MYGAAALYRLTGESVFHEQFLTDAGNIGAGSVFAEDQRWGAYAYAFTPDSLNIDPSKKNAVLKAVTSTAQQKTNTSINARACRFAGDYSFPMLVGQGTTPWVFEAMVAHKTLKESNPGQAEVFLSNVFTTADYFLGCNPLNMTWVTGLGVRQPGRVFHMDSWYNGKNNEMAPGITPYGPWRDQEPGALGPWDVNWPYKTITPESIDDWPGHERWYGNHSTPLNAEFTVHQNTVYSAITYGFLSAAASGQYQPNQRPSVEITSPGTGASTVDTVMVEVNVADPDGLSDIAWVEFYNGWHKVGESTEPPFTFEWYQPTAGDIKLSAKVTDRRGYYAYSDTISFDNISTVTAIDEQFDRDFELNVYPNPTDGKVFFDFTLKEKTNIDIRLYNLSGDTLIQTRTGVMAQGRRSAQVILPKNLTPGLYIYELNSSQSVGMLTRRGKIRIE